jgi:hypothetical protein
MNENYTYSQYYETMIISEVCKILGLKCVYSVLEMEYVFKRETVDPEDIGQCLEYCFGEETELRISDYDLRAMSRGSLYGRLVGVFGNEQV